MLATVQYGPRERKVIQSVPTSGQVVVDYRMGQFAPAQQLVPLNLVSTGSDYTARIGRKIMITDFLFRYTLGFPIPSGTGSFNDPLPTLVRVMLVYDKAPVGANQPLLGDVLDTNMSCTNSSGTVHYIMAGNNLNFRTRFVTLYDKVHNMGFCYNGSTGLSPTQIGGMGGGCYQVYIKKKLPAIFSGSGNTWEAIREGAILLLAISNKDNGGFTDCPSMNISYRFRFTDD